MCRLRELHHPLAHRHRPAKQVVAILEHRGAVDLRPHHVTVLPQRQTALVAKQAASLDVLSGGRFRLGIEIGWNRIEYIALVEDFHRRGKKIEEQILVLRQLWANPLVEFQGRWHEIPDAGINPLPLKRTIPIWMGGHADPVLARAARLADGWMPGYRTPAAAITALQKLYAAQPE